MVEYPGASTILEKESLHLFAPYSFPNPVKEKSIIDSFDIKTRRFVMRCEFEDKRLKSRGDLKAELLCIPGNEIYVERLTLRVKSPV